MYFGGFNAVHNMMCIETSFIIAHTSFFFNDVFGGGWDYGIFGKH